MTLSVIELNLGNVSSDWLKYDLIHDVTIWRSHACSLREYWLTTLNIDIKYKRMVIKPLPPIL